MDQLICMGLILCILVIGYLYEKINILKAITLGVVNYFFIYVMVSALLLRLECYSNFKSVMFSLSISAIECAVLYIKKKTKLHFCFDRKECLVLFLIMMLVVPVTVEKFEFLGMGQDQGGYQIKAIELLSGNSERVIDFEEYYLLENEEQKVRYREAVASIPGYDRLDSRYITVEGASHVAGVYHGIPTWPAILALFGELFGISHMQDCQTVFFILFLMLVYYILENLNIKTVLQIPTLLLLGISPQIVWVSKSALTEMFLTVIMASFLMLLTEKNVKLRAFSCVPVIAFSFYHVTIYTMMPMFVLIYWGLYFIDKEKRYIWACNFCLMLYYIGFLFMHHMEYAYTINNYVIPLSSFLGFITPLNFGKLVAGVTVMAIIVTNLLPMMNNEFMKKIGTFLYKSRGWIVKGLVLVTIAFFIYQAIQNGATLENIGTFTLISYASATGLVILPVTILLVMILRKKDMQGAQVYVVLFSLIYTILFYSAFLKVTCPYHFYYGRYIVPFIFIILVAFCLLCNKYRLYWLFLLCFIGVLNFAEPYSKLMSSLDDTNLSWRVLEDVLEIVDEEDAATIIDKDLYNLLYLPIRSTQSHIYPMEENLEAQLEFLDLHYDDIFYISTDDEEMEDLLYRNECTSSNYSTAKMQDITNYPLAVEKRNVDIYVYELD